MCSTGASPVGGGARRKLLAIMADRCLGPSLCNRKLLLLHHHHLPTTAHFAPSSPLSSRSLAVSMASPSPPSHPTSGPEPDPTRPSLLVFSGGTAFNGVVEELKTLTTRVAHVLPVSDDGGSTAEIVRVLGGPAVGDIRSRCLRLSNESTLEALSVRRLLGHRLPHDPKLAKSEWYNVVEGDHSLWDGVSRPYRETIRAFLVYFQNERMYGSKVVHVLLIQILRRPNESFCFSNGRSSHIFQSLDAAIFLFSRVSEIPSESLVLPVISTNDRLTLGCELWDGTVIRGQNEISHPTTGTMEPVKKECSSCPALPSRIKRVFYLSREGTNSLHEVYPSANPAVLDQLRTVDCIVYAMGSLFTSVCPSLVLLGIGEIISSQACPKVLLLNGSHDRETSGFSASSFVTAITDALNRTYGNSNNSLENLKQIAYLTFLEILPHFEVKDNNNPPQHALSSFCAEFESSQYINTLFVPKDGAIPVDIEDLATQGISNVVVVDSIHDPKVGVVYDPKSLIQALANLMGR